MWRDVEVDCFHESIMYAINEESTENDLTLVPLILNLCRSAQRQRTCISEVIY